MKVELLLVNFYYSIIEVGVYQFLVEMETHVGILFGSCLTNYTTQGNTIESNTGVTVSTLISKDTKQDLQLTFNVAQNHPM